MFEVPPKAYHLQIRHNRDDRSPISPAEPDIDRFEKRIISIHNLMIGKRQLPSLDPIRRAAEEVDGIFAKQTFPETVPKFVRGRLPAYGERRILAFETVLCELGFCQRTELDAALAGEALPSASAPTTAAPYVPEVSPADDSGAGGALKFAPGDRVRVGNRLKPGHIRTPCYLFGKQGRIVRLQGHFLNPEEIAHYKPTVAKLPLYLVEFELGAIWGELCPARSRADKLQAEFYEHWLSPAIESE